MLLKLDFENAFNSLCSDEMLKAVEDLAPSLLPLCSLIFIPLTLFHLCYFGEIKPWSHLRVCNKAIPWVHCDFALVFIS